MQDVNTEKHIVLFHRGCMDGICSAAIVRKFLGKEANITFIPSMYGDGVNEKSLDSNTTLWIVDFSVPPLSLIVALDTGCKVIWIDHHESMHRIADDFKHQNLTIIFDSHRSSSWLCWETLFPSAHKPKAVVHIDDRDMWKFKFELTRAFGEGMFNYVHAPDDKIMQDLLNCDDLLFQEMVLRGQTLLESKDRRIDRAINRGYFGYIRGIRCFYVNTGEDTSEVGERVYMSNIEPLVVVIYQYIDDGKIKFSLRSNTINVREIAEKYGGGGHDFAAGFTLEIENEAVNKRLHNHERYVK